MLICRILVGISQSRRLKEHADKDPRMRLILAILVPWLQFFTIGRPFAGLICLILQITLIGWIPAAIWSVYALSQFETDRKIRMATGGR